MSAPCPPFDLNLFEWATLFLKMVYVEASPHLWLGAVKPVHVAPATMLLVT